MALRTQQLLAQRLQKVGVIEQPREAVRHGRALGTLVARDLDHLGVAQLAADVGEIVEDRHAQARVAPERRAHSGAVLEDPPPVTLGPTLAEVEVREQVEQRRVEGVARVALLLDLGEQHLLAARRGLQEIEQGVAEGERIGRALHALARFMSPRTRETV